MLKTLLYSSSEGLSILLSVILISLIVVFSIGVTTLVTDSARQAANVKQGTTAYYAAEAGLEQALWVNRTLSQSAQGAIGANESGTTGALGDATAGVKFKIQGTTANLVEKTVNGKYIIPFPWTGNVPWHGEGSNAVTGGCNPEKPPVREGTGNSKTFAYPGVATSYRSEIEHPCNWGKLGVGEKVSIPLYGVGTGGAILNFDDIKIRVRTPCKDNQEFCSPEDRLDLNCWDKGSQERKCKTGLQASSNPYRGEVVLLWQVNGTSGSDLLTLNPLEAITTVDKYDPWDTQFYEGKINKQVDTTKTFEVLNSKTSPFPSGGAYTYPVGKVLSTGVITPVKDFIASSTKPTLILSTVSSLVGCFGKNSCDIVKDDPAQTSTYDGPHMVPYLEYQIILENGSASYPPVSKDNIISAEGQSGPFNQTIQVKVPTDSSTLEYVIQQ